MGMLPGSGSPQDKYKVAGEAFTGGKICLLWEDCQHKAACPLRNNGFEDLPVIARRSSQQKMQILCQLNPENVGRLCNTR